MLLIAANGTQWAQSWLSVPFAEKKTGNHWLPVLKDKCY